MGGTFLSLNPNAEIFEKIKILQPKWWILLREDTELYIDIRKDNYIDVYYFGGVVTKIDYKKGAFTAITHQKYLDDDKPRQITKQGRKKFEYDSIDLMKLTKKQIADIKEHIYKDYLRHINAEKWIQGKMIIENSNYIDSEFQFNKDVEIGKLRIDLIELYGGVLTFVELKGISDSRLMHDDNRNPKTPEIVEQMRKYQLFINKYEAEIIVYYKSLLEIKQNLGVTTLAIKQFILNKTPKLIIVDTYKKSTKRRSDRIYRIKELLENNKIAYEIVK
jgi:hypothetical protein